MDMDDAVFAGERVNFAGAIKAFLRDSCSRDNTCRSTGNDENSEHLEVRIDHSVNHEIRTSTRSDEGCDRGMTLDISQLPATTLTKIDLLTGTDRPLFCHALRAFLIGIQTLQHRLNTSILCGDALRRASDFKESCRRASHAGS